ncbi:polysaccharide pyruvyl transferase family protein [Halomonas qaidamensis]|uniref:Polysaccharide pyruvyl transferase family protein n=1 Tax=Halomonas qaidamensis TaxID=2866211 RepID=A0ABY6JL96_9GAMM|nr:polysaccharide pyruvyl transferase family protein [Halomonas qaidamensis]UYV18072.1 polysaccharide pyruvyl transferase family protein [Halomonas qaidamensis]
MSHHIFYVANTQADNLGDLVINTLLLKELSNRGSLNINIRGCSSNYRGMLESVNSSKTEKSYPLYVLSMLFLSLKGEKVSFYLKPGHFYGNDGGVVKKTITLFCYILMKFSGVKISRLGASLGPYRPISGKIERLQSLFFKAYTAREYISISYAKKIGIKNLEYCPDMAFLLEKDKSPASHHEGPVIISFREKTLSDDTENLELAPTLIAAASHFKGKPMLAVSQVTSDAPHNQALADKIDSNVKHVIFDSLDDGSKIFDTYSKASYVLSNRLHVLLFAASKGAIPIPIIDKDKHIKITGIFDAANLGDLIFDVNSKDDIVKHLIFVEENRTIIEDKLELAFEQQKNKILNFFDK